MFVQEVDRLAEVPPAAIPAPCLAGSLLSHGLGVEDPDVQGHRDRLDFPVMGSQCWDWRRSAGMRERAGGRGRESHPVLSVSFPASELREKPESPGTPDVLPVGQSPAAETRK